MTFWCEAQRAKGTLVTAPELPRQAVPEGSFPPERSGATCNRVLLFRKLPLMLVFSYLRPINALPQQCRYEQLGTE